MCKTWSRSTGYPSTQRSILKLCRIRRTTQMILHSTSLLPLKQSWNHLPITSIMTVQPLTTYCTKSGCKKLKRSIICSQAASLCAFPTCGLAREPPECRVNNSTKTNNSSRNRNKSSLHRRPRASWLRYRLRIASKSSSKSGTRLRTRTATRWMWRSEPRTWSKSRRTGQASLLRVLHSSSNRQLVRLSVESTEKVDKLTTVRSER